jgi:hypothetical protein
MCCAGTFEQSMGARNRVGIGLLYRTARLHWMAESIPGLLQSFKISYLTSPLGLCSHEITHTTVKQKAIKMFVSLIPTL